MTLAWLLLIGSTLAQSAPEASSAPADASEAASATPAAPAAEPAAPAPPAPKATDGEPLGAWGIAESEAGIQARIDAVVEEASQAFFFLIRSIAYNRIQRGATWCHTYTFVNTEEQVGWACDSGAATVFPRSELGKRRTIEVLGEPTDVIMRKENGHITATFFSDTGSRTQRFIPLPNGQLRLEAQIESEKLEAPIKWTILYKGGTIGGS